ncbi:hypothetical protein [Streptomyces jumonjinensis]|uniref:Uncharacterized protein n=1 Tax=Streptomyces jumonjinensis TaxID=1945 RepID=A0A646KCT6_STRJU|nr:hypothetical protein [Streptomyces jumonjinensis]MQT00109.1 hypothetical protein [Streptomyces jumonjinensis]
METDEAAPCRHAGIPPATVVDSVVRLVENLGAHPGLLAKHGLTQQEFSNALPAAIEQIRGRRSAATGARQEFMTIMLQGLVDRGIASALEVPKSGADAVYRLTVDGIGDVAVIRKGAPDGTQGSVNWSVPDWAQETYLWWVFDGMKRNPGSEVAKGVSRLRKVFLTEDRKMLDGVIFHNDLCGTPGRLCPKNEYAADFGDWRLPPPCVYVMPDHDPGASSWNWDGATRRKFPGLLLGAFGIPAETAPLFTGHVGFRIGERKVKRTVITSRFGPANATTYRS